MRFPQRSEKARTKRAERTMRLISILCPDDTERFARNIEAAYRQMFA
jgi:hypothetical protein